MPGPLALSALLIALYGTAHCAAMCGGFVIAAFTPAAGGHARFALALPLHAGRLASYAAAGGLAGALGATPALLVGSARFQSWLFVFAAAALVLTGLRLVGFSAPMGAPADFGQGLWRRALGAVNRLGSTESPGRRLALGVLWGWAPCALVYSALPLALVSGSAWAGALVMLAFGIGTLPALLGAGWLAGRGRERLPGRWASRAAGVLILVLAAAGIAQALGIADTALGAFCINPAH